MTDRHSHSCRTCHTRYPCDWPRYHDADSGAICPLFDDDGHDRCDDCVEAEQREQSEAQA